MPSKPSPKPSNDKVYKANPAPVKDPNFSATGWVKDGKFSDNRDLKEVGEGDNG
jgi:hypothetical protein